MKKFSNVPVAPVSSQLGWFIVTLGALFYCYEFFLRVAPSVMIPALMDAYHVHAAQIGVLSAFYYYAYTPMQLIVGVLMDRYGPRRLLTAALIFCVLGSYLFEATNSIYFAEIGRFFVGFGSAFAFVGVLKLASVWLPPERFAMVSGITTALGMVGAMCGDIILTDLVKHAGWRHSMELSAILGIILAVLIWLFVRDSLPGERKQDAHQFRDMRHALIALLQVAKDWRVWLVGIIGNLLFLPTTAFAALWGINYIHEVYRLSTEDAGVVISMIFLGWAIGGPVAGWFSDYIKRRRLPIMIGSLVAGVLISLVIYMPGFPVKLLYPALLVFGIFSSVQVITFALGCDYISSKAAGTVVAFVNMLVTMGGLLFQPLIGFMLDMARNYSCPSCSQDSTVYTAFDYHVALFILPLGLFAGFVLSFFIKETHCKPLLRKG